MKLPKWKDDEDFDVLDFAMTGILATFAVSFSFIHWSLGFAASNLFLFAFFVGKKWERVYPKKKTGV